MFLDYFTSNSYFCVGAEAGSEILLLFHERRRKMRN